MRTWLIIIGGLVALGILLDSIRRMRSAKRDSFDMDLHMQKGLKDDVDEAIEQQLRAELPNGGARTVSGEVTNIPRPSKSAAYLAKTTGANKEKQEPRLGTAPPLDDTQKIRRTPTLSTNTASPLAADKSAANIDLEQPVPMLMDADDRGEATFNDDRDPFMSGSSPILSKPRVVPRKAPVDSTADVEREVIVINVMSRAEGFVGAELLENVLTSGMRYGDMNIFHYYASAPDDDCALYSMANILKPGTFDLNSMQSFQTPGVSFFMALPLKTNKDVSAMDVFDKMYNTAKRISQKLNGELKDENRSVMTGQTIEHCRQRISEFSRKKLSRSGKYTADH